MAEGTEAPWPEDGQEQQDQWHDDETEPADAAETWNDDSSAEPSPKRART